MTIDEARLAEYRRHGIDPANPNPDGSDYHIMNLIDAAMDEPKLRKLIEAVRELRGGFEKLDNGEMIERLDKIEREAEMLLAKDVITAVQDLRNNFEELGVLETEKALGNIERKLGGLLPPIGGRFTINLSGMIKR